MTRILKKALIAAPLALCCALPALAQMSPNETNLDKSAARMEMRNAKGGQLTAVSPEQAQANELRRCANLPAFYRTDCEARVRGQGGEVSGSVIGGGLIRETSTQMPQSELDAQMRSSQPMTLPAARP